MKGRKPLRSFWGQGLRIWAWISASTLMASLFWHQPALSAVGPPPANPSDCREAAEELALALDAGYSPAAAPVRIAIVIDDLGYSRRLGSLATALPGSLTLAVLPQSPHGRRIAQQAVEHGKEVMVHLPMSNLAGQPLDAGGLTETMDHEGFLTVLRSNLAAIPQAKGANNHMGSLLTQHREPMEWLMDELQAHNLYFVDSRTSPASVALDVARERGVPVLDRRIFLDNQRSCDAIAAQFQSLERIARRRGQALAIGHPYPETLSFLSGLLPRLESAGLLLMPVSALLADQQKPEEVHSSENQGDLFNTRSMK